jgi:hypothetical protein
MTYYVQDTPSGAKTLVAKNDREVRIHSAFDPLKEASRSIGSFNPGRKGYIVALGLGLGYHIAELRKKFPNRTVIAVERDNEVAAIAKKECPSNIDGITIISAQSDLSMIFEEIDISEFRGFSVFTYRPSYLIDPKFYDHIIIEMNRYASSKISDLLTRFEFEEKWAANILENIPHLFTSSSVRPLFGAFLGYPGIIVSAGPSLKKNVRLLSELRDRALICCVDTSAKVLHRLGISPHIIMALDAQPHSIRHFLGGSPKGTVLLADLVSCPKVARDYSGMKIFSTTAKYFNDEHGKVKREPTPLMDWVELSVPDIGDIQSGGSVATSLFDFLLNAGCDPIILVGQDLAYTGREIHTSGTYHNDEWLTHTTRTFSLDTINQKVIRKRKIKYTEAWGGGTVITDFVLDLYRQWFEDSIGKVGLRVVNATEGGARINGAEETTLAALSASLQGKTITPEEILISSIGRAPHRDVKPFFDALVRARDSIQPLVSFNDDPENFSRALGILADAKLARIFSPYLKKTNAYLNRHPELPHDRVDALLAKDIIRAAKILVSLFDRCIGRILV